MDHPRGLATPASHARVRPRTLLGLLVLAVLALVGGAFPSFSRQANLYVLVLGAGIAWLGLSGRVHRRADPARPSRAALWWLVPALLLAAFEVVDLLLGSTYPHPTMSKLMDPVLDHYGARSAAYFGWLAAFWAMVRR
ncbi:hypothetical protein GCM10023322_17320 [Rugosimonospora acidiphila]|uniref:Uncharacterized protein n=1 Tax=Rugosimonospora acidiphila TaxID=556531 RepID=A0ABP9RP72_9ACTN